MPLTQKNAYVVASKWRKSSLGTRAQKIYEMRIVNVSIGFWHGSKSGTCFLLLWIVVLAPVQEKKRKLGFCKNLLMKRVRKSYIGQEKQFNPFKVFHAVFFSVFVSLSLNARKSLAFNFFLSFLRRWLIVMLLPGFLVHAAILILPLFMLLSCKRRKERKEKRENKNSFLVVQFNFAFLIFFLYKQRRESRSQHTWN